MTALQLLVDQQRDQQHGELMGTKNKSPQFPWLIKCLDCHELLSVQVHPDDAAAQRLLGEPFGKTESWIVLHSEPTARIYAGLQPGVDRNELIRRAQDGTVAECLHSFTPQAGDFLHIPAGTVHAVGGGVVIAEVQQSSDATFRLFDWNRVDAQGKSRELHLDRALECIDFQRGPLEPKRSTRGIDPGQEGVSQETLVRSSHYELTRISLGEPCDLASDGITVYLVLAGTGLLTLPDGEYRRLFPAGELVLVPATVSDISWEPVGSQPVQLLTVQQP
jgi:mannose-6-phosphate isomerase